MSKLITALGLCLMASAAQAEPFTFIALGDAPYGKPDEVYPAYETLIATINAKNPALVVHIGDIKSGSTPCSDELLSAQLDFMNSFAAPVMYTPGDNEWTDCHRKAAGEFDPLDRLAFLRAHFFAAPKTLGQKTLDEETQVASGYPENARLMLNDVMFVTTHVVGSNNNFEVRDPKAVEEFFARDAANIVWLKESFAAAKDSKALVISMQADMFEFDWNEFDDYAWLRHSGFATFGNALISEAAAYGKPVLLVYGDSHMYREARPFPLAAPNVLALEVPGEAHMDAVEVTVDVATGPVFSTMLLKNPAMASN
ncbi:MAG: metallophosphoesterase [Deltaproteobacteria bacterium]